MNLYTFKIGFFIIVFSAVAIYLLFYIIKGHILNQDFLIKSKMKQMEDLHALREKIKSNINFNTYTMAQNLTEKQIDLLGQLRETSPKNFGKKTGSTCDFSGVYQAGKDQFIPLAKGEKFPPCKGCASQFWFLVIAL